MTKKQAEFRLKLTIAICDLMDELNDQDFAIDSVVRFIGHVCADRANNIGGLLMSLKHTSDDIYRYGVGKWKERHSEEIDDLLLNHLTDYDLRMMLNDD